MGPGHHDAEVVVGDHAGDDVTVAQAASRGRGGLFGRHFGSNAGARPDAEDALDVRRDKHGLSVDDGRGERGNSGRAVVAEPPEDAARERRCDDNGPVAQAEEDERGLVEKPKSLALWVLDRDGGAERVGQAGEHGRLFVVGGPDVHGGVCGGSQEGPVRGECNNSERHFRPVCGSRDPGVEKHIGFLVSGHHIVVNDRDDSVVGVVGSQNRGFFCDHQTRVGE